MKRHQHSRQHRHRPKSKRKKPPLRMPATGSDEEKVLRALLAQMPLVQELARVGRMDLQEAADGMVNLIELGLYKLVVHSDGRCELTAVDKQLEHIVEQGTT
ncbi:MAG TPA: hypothetical protein VM715_03950 [Candidatus Acidoferrum sp.]|nr:hypothetical protein [Candidatus Acidoferrum sp.]